LAQLYAQFVRGDNTKRLGAGIYRFRAQILLYTSLGEHYSLRTYSFIFLIGRDPAVIPRRRVQMKGSLTLLSLVLAGAVFAAMPASGRQAASETKAASAAQKETKWQGNVVRIYKDESQMDIRGTTPSGQVRKVAYDSSTQWTKGGKPGQQDEVKEGSFVIVLGKPDDKGVLHATRVDLRLPR